MLKKQLIRLELDPRLIFNRLRTSLKIKLRVDLMNSIDGIIMNNMTAFLDNYAYDLSDIR